jgi:mannan endo-1,4-beta-mannosidase
MADTQRPERHHQACLEEIDGAELAVTGGPVDFSNQPPSWRTGLYLSYAVFLSGGTATSRNTVSALRGLLGGARAPLRMPLIVGRCDLCITAQRQVGREPSSNAAPDRGFHSERRVRDTPSWRPGQGGPTGHRTRAAGSACERHRDKNASTANELQVHRIPAGPAEIRANHQLAISQSSQQVLSVTEPQAEPTARRGSHRKAMWVCAVVGVALLIGAVIRVAAAPPSASSVNSAQPISILGVYERDAPLSYAGVNAFTTDTGVSPDVLMYYSTWKEPFQASFATTAAEHHAVPLIQINPFGVSLAAVAAGQYDGYLSAYAEAVSAYGHPVILSFGHEMNGNWYPWGDTHTSPAVFVAAWRHIVTLFRELGVRNVTWLWTVNIIDTLGGIPPPAAWWPGSSYVTWVGLDGYYYQPSWTFASLFGPTIASVRELTNDPILIAETGAAAGPSQSAKIAELFAGVRLYGLLGFVWFDASAGQDWSLSSPAASAAFYQGAKTYYRPMP